MAGIHKLAATKVARVTKPGRYGDGAGLWLQVTKSGSKSWIYQYRARSRVRQLGLGPLLAVPLAEARKRAQAARELVAAGIDPIDAKKARHAATPKTAEAVTFADAASDYIASKSAEWRNAKHRQQWRNSIANYANPVFGHLPVEEVTTNLVLKALRPIWTEKPETGGRLRGRIERILGAAKAAGHRSGDNPARWHDHLEHSLPALGKLKKVRHHPALPFAELPTFIAGLRKREGIAARALELLILTTARTGALIGMRDEEVDFEARVWTCPAERMKTGIKHATPLCDRAIEILRTVPREKGNPHFFAGGKPGSHLSNMAMLQLMRRLGSDFTPHGFRSCFRDWAAETSDFDGYVVDKALAHAIESKVERAYRRGDLLDKRRPLMKAWADFAGSKGAGR